MCMAEKEHHSTFHRAAFSVGWRWNHEASCVWCLASPVWRDRGYLTWVFKPDAIYTYLISGNHPLWVWGFSNFPRLDSPKNTSVCCNRPGPSRNENGWLFIYEFLFHIEKNSTAWLSSNRAAEICTNVQRCLLTFGSSVRLVSKGAALVPPTISSHAKISPVAMKLPAWLDQVVQGSSLLFLPIFSTEIKDELQPIFFKKFPM